MNPLHYPSLELCKRLTEVWFKINREWTYRNSFWIYNKNIEGFELESTDFICLSVMDMLEYMPISIRIRWKLFLRTIHWIWDNDIWFTYRTSTYVENDYLMFLHWKSLPDLCAEMLLSLLKNKYITI